MIRESALRRLGLGPMLDAYEDALAEEADEPGSGQHQSAGAGGDRQEAVSGSAGT